jgi:hypothetical protein
MVLLPLMNDPRAKPSREWRQAMRKLGPSRGPLTVVSREIPFDRRTPAER